MARTWSELPALFSLANILFLAQGAAATLALSAIGSCLGGAFAFGVAVLRLTRSAQARPFRWLATGYVEIIRRVPFLVTLMMVFFSFQLSGFDLPLFAVGAISVTLIATAFLAEIVRAGFDSVHTNQWDAARAMNFGLLATIRHVVLPQALPVILPPAFSFFILFLKDTALASQIGVVELTYVGKVLNNKGFSAGLVFGTVLRAYFALSYPLTRLGARLENRLAASRRGRR
jgi:polar amino acid transport system permease protein